MTTATPHPTAGPVVVRSIVSEIQRLSHLMRTDFAYQSANHDYYAGQIQAYYNVLKTIDPYTADYNLGVSLYNRV